MDWLTEGGPKLPINLSAQRTSIVLRQKVDILELEVCHPVGLIRERPFWRSDKVDFYHLLPDDTIKHTPGD